MKILTTLLIAATLVVIGGVGIAYSGLYDVSASSPHSGLVNWLLSTTSHASIKRRSSEVGVPDLSDESLARAGINDFDAMCAACHGAPGRLPGATGKGLNPPAPDLADSAAHMTPGELFWVTKHGIKMTGMPAWGASHDDEALWPVVAFMTTLPDLDANDYQALLATAEGMGHHADDDDPANSDHGEAAMHNEIQDADADDHSTHSHDEPIQPKTEEPHDDAHDHEH